MQSAVDRRRSTARAARTLRGSRWTRALLTLRVLVLASIAAVGLAGCIKRPPIARLPKPTGVGVGFVADSLSQRQPLGAPRELEAEVGAVLATRNLVARAVAPEATDTVFGRSRDSSARRRALAASLAGSPYLLLVEMQPSFYSQLSGRYKWNVYVKLSVWSRGDPSSALEDTFESPAFLIHDHEREPEAMADVSGTIARRVALFVDTFFASQPRQ
jgi:hypothetical protein